MVSDYKKKKKKKTRKKDHALSIDCETHSNTYRSMKQTFTV